MIGVESMAKNDRIRGVILAGGLGTRLHPLTDVTNKHLLPIYHKPMVFYPIETLVKAGIREIMLVTGGRNAGDFLRLLGNGEDFGLTAIHYAYQKGEGGIAEALRLARHFVGTEKHVVILGDNIIEDDISGFVRAFEKQKSGAKILLKEAEDAERFGVAEFEKERVVRITEKPKKPKTKWVVTGVYMYDSQVFEIIEKLKPSGRGELEITDVNNAYIERGLLTYEKLSGYWSDAGTFESLHRANILVAEKFGKLKRSHA